MVLDGCKSIKETSTPGWTSITWYEGKESFTQGKYAMYFDCDFFGAGYEDKNTSKVAGKVGYAPPLAPSPDKRWTNLRDNHELYNLGHLLEGGIAYFLATGRRRLLDILRAAALVMGLYLAKIYEEVKGRPLYIVHSRFGQGPGEGDPR